MGRESPALSSFYAGCDGCGGVVVGGGGGDRAEVKSRPI